MATPINLNKARKSKARSDAKTLAAANRVKFGRTKGEKAAVQTELGKLDRQIDAHKRES